MLLQSGRLHEVPLENLVWTFMNAAENPDKEMIYMLVRDMKYCKKN